MSFDHFATQSDVETATDVSAFDMMSEAELREFNEWCDDYELTVDQLNDDYADQEEESEAILWGMF